MVQAFAVEEVFEVYGWVVWIMTVKSVCALRLSVVALECIEVMVCPIGRLTECTR